MNFALHAPNWVLATVLQLCLSNIEHEKNGKSITKLSNEACFDCGKSICFLWATTKKKKYFFLFSNLFDLIGWKKITISVFFPFSHFDFVVVWLRAIANANRWQHLKKKSSKKYFIRKLIIRRHSKSVIRPFRNVLWSSAIISWNTINRHFRLIIFFFYFCDKFTTK